MYCLHFTQKCPRKNLWKHGPFDFMPSASLSHLGIPPNREPFCLHCSIIRLKPENVYRRWMVSQGLRPKMFEENQLKYVVQQNMLLWVLELGYDNEFQTQIFSLIATKNMWGAKGLLSEFGVELVAFHYQRLIVRKLFSQPEILIGQREGRPHSLCGWLFKRRMNNSYQHLNTSGRIARWWILVTINPAIWG